MKYSAYLISFFLVTNVWAAQESVSFQCWGWISKVNVTKGDVVQVSGCISADEERLEVCDGEGVPYITVIREGWAGIDEDTPPVFEIAKIPGLYFDFKKDNDFLHLSMDSAKLGEIKLNYIGGDYKGEQELVLNTNTFKNSFTIVDCDYSTNRL